nr:uncharacterized protein LOC110282460 [Parasteatoda tepidariorum]
MAEKSNQSDDTETTNISDALQNSGFEKDFVQECSKKRSCNESQDEIVQIDADNFENVAGARKIVSFKEKTSVLESTKNIPSSKSPLKLKTGESATATTSADPNFKLSKTAYRGKSAISTLPVSPHSKVIKSPLREKPATSISPDSHFRLIKTASKEENAIPATSESPSHLSSHWFHNTSRGESSQYESQITRRKPNLQKMGPISNRYVTQHSLQQSPNQLSMTHSYSVFGQYERNFNNWTHNWQNARSSNVKRGSRYDGHSNLPTPHLSQHASQTVFDWYRSNDIGRPQNRQNIRSKNEKLQPTSASDSSVLQTSYRSHNDEQSASVRYKSRIRRNSPSTSQDLSAVNENQDATIETIRQNILSKNIRSAADSSIHHMSHTSQVASNTSTQCQSQITTTKSSRPNIHSKYVGREPVTDPSILQTSHHPHDASEDVLVHCKNQARCRNVPSKNMSSGPKKVRNPSTVHTSYNIYPTSQATSAQYGYPVNAREPSRPILSTKNAERKPRFVTNSSILQNSQKFHNISQNASSQYKSQFSTKEPKRQTVRSKLYVNSESRSSTDPSIQHSQQFHNTSQVALAQYGSQFSTKEPKKQTVRSKNINSDLRSDTNSLIQQNSQQFHNTSQVASAQYTSQFSGKDSKRQIVRSKDSGPRSATDPSIQQTSQPFHNTSQVASAQYKNQFSTKEPKRQTVRSKLYVNSELSSFTDPSIQHSQQFHNTSQVASAQYVSQFSTKEPKKQTVRSKNINLELRSDTNSLIQQNSQQFHNTSQIASAQYTSQFSDKDSKRQIVRSKDSGPRSATDPSIQQTSQPFRNTSQVASAQYKSQCSDKELKKQTVRSKNINSKPRSVTDSPIQQTLYQYNNTTQAVTAQFENNVSTEKSKLQRILLNNMKAESLDVPKFSIENFPPISSPVPKALCKRIVTVIKSKKVSKNNLEETNLVAGSSNIQNTQHSIKTVEVKDLEKSQNIEICSHISRILPENVTQQTSKSEETASVENVTLTESSQIFPFIKEPVSKAVYIRSITLIEENRMMDYNLEEQVLVTETRNSENISYSPKEEKNSSSGNYGLPTSKQPVTISNDKECFNSTKVNTVPNTNLEQNILYPDLSTRLTTYHSTNYEKNESTENDVLVSFQKCQNLPYFENPKSTFNEENEVRDVNTALPSNAEQHILISDFSTNYIKNESTDPNVLVSFEKCKDLSFRTHPVSAPSVKENVLSRKENVNSGEENVTSREENFSFRDENKISESYMEKQISDNSSSHDFPIAGEYGSHKLQSFSYNCKIGESSYSMQNNAPREFSRQLNRNLEENRLVDSSFNIHGLYDTGTAEKTHNYDYLTPQEFQFYQNIPPPLHCTNNITFNEANRLSDPLLEEHSLAIRPLDIENISHIPNTSKIEHTDPHNIQYYPYISYIVPTQDHQTTREANSVLSSTLEDPSSIQDTHFFPNSVNMVPIVNDGFMELQNFPCVSRPISGLNYVFNDNFSETDKLLVRNQDSPNTCEFGNAENYSSMLQNILYLPSIAEPIYLPYVNSATGSDRSLITSSSSVQENISIHQNYQQQYVPAIAQSLPYANGGTDREVLSERLESGYHDNNSTYQNSLLSSTEPAIVSYVNSAPDVEDYIRRLVFGSSVVQDNISTP